MLFRSSRILLHKVDKATGKGIYGAVFLLYDSNHNPIGEYVTDQDGYIYADEDWPMAAIICVRSKPPPVMCLILN